MRRHVAQFKPAAKARPKRGRGVWRGRRVQIREGWMYAGDKGTALTEPMKLGGKSGTTWIGVLWDKDDDPDWHKFYGVESVSVLRRVGGSQ